MTAARTAGAAAVCKVVSAGEWPLRDVVIRHRSCHRAHVPAICAANHINHEKEIAWVSITMHICGFVPTVMVLRSWRLLDYFEIMRSTLRNY